MPNRVLDAADKQAGTLNLSKSPYVSEKRPLSKVQGQIEHEERY